MKRVVTLVGIPVLLALVWWSGESGKASTTAEVTIDTAKVVELRGLVISRLGGVGATKTAEATEYGDDGRSDLTFRIPPARLEEALVELNLVGGNVTKQEVQLDELTDQTDGIASGITGVGGCLDTLSQRIDARQLVSATDEVATCRKQLEATGKQLQESPQAARDAVLEVHILRTSTSSPALVVAVALLAIALATMAYLTLRSTRRDVLDITERRAAHKVPDLYDRRN